MADAGAGNQGKKDSKGSRRYANGPRVAAKPSGTPAAASSEPAAARASAPEASVTSGTDGIPVTDRHAAERDEMAMRHATEMKDMHKRQANDMSVMMQRHMAEMGSGAITPGEDA